MTTYVEPQGAQLGDAVTGFAVTGEIVGVDTQGPAILVRWHDSRAMDVYSLSSPVWNCFGIVRPVTVDVTAQGVVDVEESDMVVDRNPMQPRSVSEDARTITGPFTLPWSK